MIIVSGKVKVSPGTRDGLKAEMEAAITATRQEEGCVGYHYGFDVIDADTFIVMEHWRDEAALAAHFKQPYMAKWMTALQAAGIVENDVKIYQADDGKPIFG